MKETDKMFFLGATYNGRYINNISGSYAKIEKTVFGIDANIACECRLSETVGTGLKLSVTADSFKMYGMTDRMNVSSLMIIGFISFRIK